MLSRQLRDDKGALEKVRDAHLIMDSSKVAGYIASGSNVYVPLEAVTGLPRGRAFVIGFVCEEGPRYFNASRVGGNGKRATLQLGSEHDPIFYRHKGTC